MIEEVSFFSERDVKKIVLLQKKGNSFCISGNKLFMVKTLLYNNMTMLRLHDRTLFC